MPEGALFTFSSMFPPISATRGGGTAVISDDVSFCNSASNLPHVNVVPGSAFGSLGYARMSYATSRDEIRGGIEHLAKWLVG